MQPVKKVNPAIVALIVIVLIGAVVAVIIISNGKSSSNSNTSQSTGVHGTYKDGEYTETGSYITPGGKESISVTIVLKDNTITSTTLAPNGSTTQAQQYQADFEAGYKTLVVGKNLDDVSLSRVSGSSLTSTGFNAALELIKTDARS